MSFQPGQLSNYFKAHAEWSKESPRPAAALPPQYKNEQFAVMHMMDSLSELGRPEQRLSAEDVEQYAAAIGGAGHDAAYEHKMSCVGHAILNARDEDGTMTVRRFAAAMAFGGTSLPAAIWISPSLRDVAAQSLAHAGVTPDRELVSGLSRIGQALALQARTLNPVYHKLSRPAEQQALVAA